jgi:hypothetical protein
MTSRRPCWVGIDILTYALQENSEQLAWISHSSGLLDEGVECLVDYFRVFGGSLESLQVKAWLPLYHVPRVSSNTPAHRLWPCGATVLQDDCRALEYEAQAMKLVCRYSDVQSRQVDVLRVLKTLMTVASLVSPNRSEDLLHR